MLVDGKRADMEFYAASLNPSEMAAEALTKFPKLMCLTKHFRRPRARSEIANVRRGCLHYTATKWEIKITGVEGGLVRFEQNICRIKTWIVTGALFGSTSERRSQRELLTTATAQCAKHDVLLE